MAVVRAQLWYARPRARQQVAVGWLPSLAVPTTTVTVWATYEYLENTNQRFL